MALTASLRWLGRAVEQTATSAGLVTVDLRLPDIRFLPHYHEKVKQPLATRQAAALLGYRVAAIDQTGSLVFRSGLIGPFKVQGTSPVAIPQIPKGWQILPFRLFLASALRGLYSIYAIYRGMGLVLGVVFGLVLGFGDGVCLQRLLRLENSIQCFRALHNSWVILSLVRLNKSHRRVYPALVASPNSPDRWRTGSGFRFELLAGN